MPLKTDTQIEDEAVSFFLDENLDPQEQQTLMDVVENDPALSVILDKIVLRAIEKSDDGEVVGPGTGTSDEVLARLSDGEFVFTAKAVEAIGVENLEQMMKEAEDGTSLLKSSAEQPILVSPQPNTDIEQILAGLQQKPVTSMRINRSEGGLIETIDLEHG